MPDNWHTPTPVSHMSTSPPSASATFSHAVVLVAWRFLWKAAPRFAVALPVACCVTVGFIAFMAPALFDEAKVAFAGNPLPIICSVLLMSAVFAWPVAALSVLELPEAPELGAD